MKSDAELTTSAPTCDKPMLGAGATSSDGRYSDETIELSAPIDCPPTNANDLLQLIQNAVPTSERMDFVVPFAKYQNVVNALEVCESYIKSLQQT